MTYLDSDRPGKTMPSREIFVFGSNLAGRHGAGSAKAALIHHGAKLGVGSGPQGNSYAIPTKDFTLHTMTLPEIQAYVRQFIEYAFAHDECWFNVVAIGCGLAGLTPEQVAPMFKGAPANVRLPKEFKAVLHNVR